MLKPQIGRRNSSINHRQIIFLVNPKRFNFFTTENYQHPLLQNKKLRSQHKSILHNNPIQQAETTKYLGLIFDQKLTWKPHILNLKASCTNKLNLMKKLSLTNYGSDRSSLLTIYHSIIRPKLDYGIAAYSSANQGILKVLDPIHHTAIHLSIGAFRTFPIISILSESGEIPLNHHRQYASICAYIHNKSNPNLPAIKHSIKNDR